IEWIILVGYRLSVRLPPYRLYTEGNLLRADGLSYEARERILDEVSRYRERMRSHGLRRLLGSISVESSHNLLERVLKVPSCKAYQHEADHGDPNEGFAGRR